MFFSHAGMCSEMETSAPHFTPKTSPSATEGFPASCSDSWSGWVVTAAAYMWVWALSGRQDRWRAQVCGASMNVQLTIWKSVCVFLQSSQRKTITDLKSFTTTKDLLYSKLFVCSDMWSFGVLFYWDVCIYCISTQWRTLLQDKLKSIRCKSLKTQIVLWDIYIYNDIYMIFIHLLLCHLYYYRHCVLSREKIRIKNKWIIKNHKIRSPLSKMRLI